jgi:import inner membrane translocase subunit TIM17
MKAARNSAIGCACLLAVIEGVGIGIQRLMAENTRLDVSPSPLPFHIRTCFSNPLVSF